MSRTRLTPILPGRLYIRGDLRRLAGGQPGLDASLDAYGIHLVIALWEPRDAVVRPTACTYLYLPVPDGRLTLQEAQVFDYAAAEALPVIRAGGGVLCVCAGGKNRSATLAALILHRLERIAGAAALDRVRAARPGAVDNAHFSVWLCGLPAPGAILDEERVPDGTDER